MSTQVRKAGRRLNRVGCCLVLLLHCGLLYAQHATEDAVSALGRLEPEHGIIHVAAALTPQSISGALVKEVLVETNDDVKAGQLLAVMDTADLVQAELEEAQAQYELAVRQAQAAGSSADEACVRARVAENESSRRSALLKKGMAGEEEAEAAAGQAEAMAASCTAARATAYAADADIAVAAAHVKRIETELRRSFVRAPVDGRVLKVVAQPGELAAGDGVVELAQVHRMYAIAEVYETDIARVRPGQQATVSSKALAGPLSGTVKRIRPQVAKQDAIGTDPAARKDARIIEVEILLDDAAAAASLTHLQVDVLIRP